MVITNDVALLTFVPFSLLTLKISNAKKYMIPVVALETVAANLGSMLTPIGDPQNLFLFSKFQMKLQGFFPVIFPYAFLSLVLIILSVLFFKNEKVLFEEQPLEKGNIKMTFLYALLFLLALLTVFRVLPYGYVTLFCVITVLAFDRKILVHIDYSLLLTFVFLFIFIGNLGNLPGIRILLENILTGREVPVAIIISQIFSNVPTAILLSGVYQSCTSVTCRDQSRRLRNDNCIDGELNFV